MNIMMQENKDGNLAVSVCDPAPEYDIITGKAEKTTDLKITDNYDTADPRHIRTLKITFSDKITLLSSRSGLPESNPDLNAKVEGDVEDILTFKTRDGVSDTFVIKLEQ